MTSSASITLVASMISTASFHQKIFNLKENIYFFDGFLLFIAWKRLLEVKIIPNLLGNKKYWLIEHQKNKNWWIWHKSAFLMNPQDPKYQQKSKAISPAEPNYFVHFAMRHPVISSNESHLCVHIILVQIFVFLI